MDFLKVSRASGTIFCSRKEAAEEVQSIDAVSRRVLSLLKSHDGIIEEPGFIEPDRIFVADVHVGGEVFHALAELGEFERQPLFVGQVELAEHFLVRGVREIGVAEHADIVLELLDADIADADFEAVDVPC